MAPGHRVEALFAKQAISSPVLPFNCLSLISGEGIENDIARSISSPRQVLVVRREDLDDFDLPMGYLGENIVILGLHAKDFQPGNSIQFDGGARLHLVMYCEPCKTIAERVPNLKSIIERRGILGVITQSGRLMKHAKFEMSESNLAVMPSNVSQRVCQVISRIPRGKVIDYPTLLVAAGLQPVYFRAIPSYLKAARACDLPSHRVVNSRLSIPEHVPKAEILLGGELDLQQLNQCRWRPNIIDILSAHLSSDSLRQLRAALQ
jgi:alkylated DNA nucleotide flippase Atl1